MKRHHILLTLLFIWGCSSLDNAMNHKKEIPLEWQDQGLVIGELANGASIGFMNLDHMDIAIDSHTPSGGIFNSVVMFKRQPGEHMFSDIFVTGYAGPNMRRMTSIPIKRKFTTKANEITYLGMMFFMQEPTDKKKFRILIFDNRDEILPYMVKNYPDLMKGRESAPINRGEGPYLSKENLMEFRHELAKHQALKNKRQGKFFVAAPAGTLAEVEVKGTDVKVLRLLPPVTFMDIHFNQYDEQGNLSFKGVGPKLFKVINGEVQETIAVKQ
jgi:hypothetical protein